MPDFLAQSLGKALYEAVERGFAVPIHVIAIGSNGALIAGYYDSDHPRDLRFEATIEYDRPEGYTLPINIMVIDSATGNAFRLFVKQEAEYLVN